MARAKASVKGLLKKWVAGRVKKYGFKGCIYRLGDEIVKATKTREDDRKWAELKEWVDGNWK